MCDKDFYIPCIKNKIRGDSKLSNVQLEEVDKFMDYAS